MTTTSARDAIRRCSWPGAPADCLEYHDSEWGRPVADDFRLFEKICLEGFQSRLSWLTILRKRESYRRAFDGFDPERIARYGERKVAALLADPGIVRNRLKVAAAIGNARAWLELRARGRTLDEVVWAPYGGRPKRNRFRSMREIPATTPGL